MSRALTDEELMTNDLETIAPITPKFRETVKNSPLKIRGSVRISEGRFEVEGERELKRTEVAKRIDKLIRRGERAESKYWGWLFRYFSKQ